MYCITNVIYEVYTFNCSTINLQSTYLKPLILIAELIDTPNFCTSIPRNLDIINNVISPCKNLVIS